jgi:7-carboxy-7-deazaguanine synthase
VDKQDFFAGRANNDTQLYVSSIFETIDGETNAFHAGTWSTFIRLQGCRVGCTWCDTKYSWPIHRNGQKMTPTEVLAVVSRFAARKVTLTGGEPMEQWGEPLSLLLYALRGAGFRISMETAGTDPLNVLLQAHPYVNIILDYKMPSAAAVRPPIMDNYALLAPQDVVKIVTKLEEVPLIPEIVHDLRREWACRARMVFSPVWDTTLQLQAFVEAARGNGLPELDVGLSLQTHKVIWPNSVRDEEGART